MKRSSSKRRFDPERPYTVGAYALSARATERYAAARDRIARYFGVEDDACLVFTRGTTEGLNLMASSWGLEFLGAGD